MDRFDKRCWHSQNDHNHEKALWDLCIYGFSPGNSSVGVYPKELGIPHLRFLGRIGWVGWAKDGD